MKTMQKENELPDDEVIEKVCAGDKGKYEILMRRYNQRLYRLGRSFFKDEDEIEELMQFTYIRAYEKLATFEHRAAFSTWLTRIFINEALAIKKYREKFYSTDDYEHIPEEETMRTPEENTVQRA